MNTIKSNINELLSLPELPPYDIDPARLVDAWVLQAEQWLLYCGTATDLTRLEAFEGIEHLGRLTRTCPDMLRDSAGDAVLERFQQIFSTADGENLWKLALQAPAPEAWLEQAEEIDQRLMSSWDDIGPSAAGLIEDLDALGFLQWWAEAAPFALANPCDPSMRVSLEFQGQINSCESWLAEHCETFLSCEAQVRAMASTIRDDLEDVDGTGLLALSALKYVTLLAEFERIAVQEVKEGVRVVGGVLARAGMPIPIGVLRKQFWTNEFATSSVLAFGEEEPDAPMREFPFCDPERRFKAVMLLPNARRPGGTTKFRVVIKVLATGVDTKTAIAELSELSGAKVRLGGSESDIQLDGLDTENPRGEGQLVAEDVPKCPEDDLTFQVNGKIWLQLPLGAA